MMRMIGATVAAGFVLSAAISGRPAEVTPVSGDRFPSPRAAAGGGACCTIDSCVPAVDEQDCTALNGVFLPGEDCATSPCGTGACCFNLNCNQADAFSCITAGRTFAGAGTSCLDDPCDAGVGACCFTDGSCLDLSPEDCATQAGNWLGAGTSCAQGLCELGACCLDQDCQEITLLECNDLGGTHIAGEACKALPCNDCPAGTLFAQQRDDPLDFIAGTSELSAGFQRWEDFLNVTGTIEGVTWWGLDLDNIGGNDFQECVESDPTFNISFHEDAGGVPGATVCSYTLTATRTPLGIFYLGAELNEYSVTLPASCVLIDGWISIVGLGDLECWFLWMSAGFGGFSWCDNCNPSPQDFDLSVCIQGTEGGVFGACCDDSTGNCTENVEITDCTGPNLRFAPDQSCDDLDPPCGTVLGACCLGDATCSIETVAGCTNLGGTWLGENSLCSSCPCVVPCPAGGIPEGEPVCFPQYVDEYNGGCIAAMQLFSPIAAGDTICGESGVFEIPGDVQPDFDWYEITLGQATDLTWSAEAEFPATIWILDGESGCADPPTLATASGLECEPLSVSTAVPPGTYWLVIAATLFVDEAQCGARYTATVSIGCPADLDDDGMVGINDFLIVIGGWDTPAGDITGDGTTDILDFLAVLGAWGSCE